jgi:hypothetical protein
VPKKQAEEPVEAPVVEAVNEAEGPVVVKLTVPRELYQEYADLASKQDLTPAELMIHRLNRCKSHTSIRSIYFSTSQLTQLEGLLQKRPVESAEHALALISAMASVRIGDFPPIPISAHQAKRIYLGAIGGQTPYDRLCMIVQGAVARATGA